MSNFIGTVIGVVFGGAITLWASRYYYLKAGRDLEDAAADLQGLATLIIRGMEEAGLATFTKDAAGKPVGLVIQASATMVGAGKLTAHAELLSATLETVQKKTWPSGLT